jgi:hypothetical protein
MNHLTSDEQADSSSGSSLALNPRLVGWAGIFSTSDLSASTLFWAEPRRQLPLKSNFRLFARFVFDFVDNTTTCEAWDLCAELLMLFCFMAGEIN